jgi:hypothetical protein
MQTSKIMHGWLPVAHMRHHITGTNQCPGCECDNETFDHFLQCPNPSITEKRKGILTQMRTTRIKLRILKDILNAITQTLTTYTKGKLEPTNHQYKAEIATGVSYQQKLGIDMMAWGFLSKQWLHTIHPSRNPTRTMNKIQRLIWMEFFEPLWKNRTNYSTIPSTPTHKPTMTNSRRASYGTAITATYYLHTTTHIWRTISTLAPSTQCPENKNKSGHAILK